MSLPSVFDSSIVKSLEDRINKLTPGTKSLWGKMTVDQMLAHCNITYELIYTDKHPKPNVFTKWVLTSFVKKKVVDETPYPKNGPTGPQFLIKEAKDFEVEKKRLLEYIDQTLELGEQHFHLKKSHSFGILKSNEWNNMLYKHLDHHLKQFGV